MPKKLLLLLLLAALTAALCPAAAAAAEGSGGTYARIERTGVYLYAEPNGETGLFELPQTYFVYVTGEYGEYCSVAYLRDTPGHTAVYGYCKSEELAFVDYIPETPYLLYTVEVTYTAGTTPMPNGGIASYRVQAAYYGSFSYGSTTCYYVETDGAFGYVPASACPVLDYPPNTEHTEPDPPPEDAAPAADGSGAVNIVLVCALAAAALGIAFFLFRPARRRKERQEEREDVYF